MPQAAFGQQLDAAHQPTTIRPNPSHRGRYSFCQIHTSKAQVHKSHEGPQRERSQNIVGMPQFADLVRHSVLLARANNDIDDDNRRIADDDNDDDSSNHRRLEIGVIVAIVVVGLALIGVVTAFILKRRKRQLKKRARQAEPDITWYATDDEPMKVRSGKTIGIALGGHEGGVVGGKTNKVAFAHEGEAPPPSYEIVVNTPSGPSK